MRVIEYVGAREDYHENSIAADASVPSRPLMGKGRRWGGVLRWTRRHWPLALALAALAMLQAKACLMDVPRILDHLTVDDTFLYLQMARNVALGKGPTFDGIHMTNGFQPLWLASVVPLGWLFVNPVSFLRAVLFLSALLNLVTLWLLYRMGLRQSGRPLAVPLIVGWTWVVVGWKPMLSGMETGLYAAVFSVFLDRLLRPRVGSKELGILGGLLLLCRVDALVYVLGGWAACRPKTLRGGMLLMAAAAIIAAPYFIWNQVVFDSPLPVSGRVKALYNRQELGEHYLGSPHTTSAFGTYLPSAAFGTIRAMIAPVECLLGGKPRRWIIWGAIAALGSLMVVRKWRIRLGVLAACSVAHMALMCVVIGRFADAAWYYAPHMVLVLLGSSMAIAFILRVSPRPAAAAGRGLLLAAWFLALVTGNTLLDNPHDPNELYSWRYGVAQWVSTHIPEDAICGSWNAGQLAFFSQRRVVNLDGLANDQHYLARLTAGKSALDYCRREKIHFLVDYDARDLSMPPGRTWDHGRFFRGEIPLGRLRLLYQMPPLGNSPYTVKVLELVPPQGGT